MERTTKVCLFLVVLAVLVGLHQVLAHGDFYELEDVLTLGPTHELFINGLAVVALVLVGSPRAGRGVRKLLGGRAKD